MARQLSTTTRNRYRDAWTTAFPAGAELRLYTGTPTGVANAAGGSLVATIVLPSSPWTTGTGEVTKNNTWSVSASGSGTVQSYRLVNGSDIEEGTAGESGTDLILDNADINAGQTVTVSTFTRTMPDA